MLGRSPESSASFRNSDCFRKYFRKNMTPGWVASRAGFCHHRRTAMATADVVVVGGGANGTSTAFHLTRLGVRNVVLLERHWLAAGATGKSGSLVRMHYTNEHESRLAFESLKVFQGFHAEVGGDCGFEPVGFVQLVGRSYADQLRRNVAMQQRIGIKTELVSPEDLPRLLPGVTMDDVGGAAWEPESGYADPNATAFAFAAAAARAGARIETGREVTRVVVEGGRVVAVETQGGRIATPVVVLVPGAWARPLLEPLGLDFGLLPYRVQIAIFRWPPGMARAHPVDRRALRDARRLGHVVQDVAGDRSVPGRVDRRGPIAHGGPHAVPRDALRRGPALDRRVQLRPRAADDLALTGVGNDGLVLPSWSPGST